MCGFKGKRPGRTQRGRTVVDVQRPIDSAAARETTDAAAAFTARDAELFLRLQGIHLRRPKRGRRRKNYFGILARAYSARCRVIPFPSTACAVNAVPRGYTFPRPPTATAPPIPVAAPVMSTALPLVRRRRTSPAPSSSSWFGSTGLDEPLAWLGCRTPTCCTSDACGHASYQKNGACSYATHMP